MLLDCSELPQHWPPWSIIWIVSYSNQTQTDSVYEICSSFIKILIRLQIFFNLLCQSDMVQISHLLCLVSYGGASVFNMKKNCVGPARLPATSLRRTDANGLCQNWAEIKHGNCQLPGRPRWLMPPPLPHRGALWKCLAWFVLSHVCLFVWTNTFIEGYLSIPVGIEQKSNMATANY